MRAYASVAVLLSLHVPTASQATLKVPTALQARPGDVVLLSLQAMEMLVLGPREIYTAAEIARFVAVLCLLHV